MKKKKSSIGTEEEKRGNMITPEKETYYQSCRRGKTCPPEKKEKKKKGDCGPEKARERSAHLEKTHILFSTQREGGSRYRKRGKGESVVRGSFSSQGRGLIF